MFSSETVLAQAELESAIVRNPLTLAPDARVVEAITLMSRRGAACSFTCEVGARLDQFLSRARSSCVLIADNGLPVGILTNCDLIRLGTTLSSTGQNLAELAIADIMVAPVQTFPVAEFTNPFAPLNLLQRHGICHLPLVDDQGRIVGLLTYDSLWQLLRPIDLLRLCVAAEVMTKEIVQAEPTITLVELTQLMIFHQASSIVIVEEQHQTADSRCQIQSSQNLDSPILNPIGIVSEQDIVQMLALELDFATIQAQAVMSMPVCSVRPDTSLWEIRLLMQEWQVNRVIVTDDAEQLLGVVTQANLLNGLNSLGSYRMIETLEQRVACLEAENVALRQNSNVELEKQVAARTNDHQLVAISDRKTAEEVLRQYERVVSSTTDGIALIDRHYVYQLVNQVYLDWHQKPLTDIVGHSVEELLGKTVFQSLVQPRLDRCLAGEVQQYEAWFDYKSGGRRFVRVTYAPYIELDGAIAGIVVNTHDLTALKQAEVALQESGQFLRNIYEGTEQAIFTVDVLEDGEFRLLAFNPACERLTGTSTAEIQGKVPFPEMQQHYSDCIQAGVPITYEESISFKGKQTWWITTLTPIRDEASRIYRLVGTSTNITDRKQTELLLEIQNTILEQIARADPLPEILNALVEAMELQLGNTLCSILLCDGEGRLRHGAAPHLPEAYVQAVDGVPISEGAGSCGTAVFRREPVIVTDIVHDPLWQDFKELALTYGLRGCWSVPLFSSHGQVLGTFVTYYREVHSPTPPDLNVITLAANIAGIAIEQAQASQALEQLNRELERRVEQRTTELQASEERWQLVLKGSNDGIWDWDVSTNQVFVSSRWKAIRGFAEDEVSGSLEKWLQGIHPDDYDRVMAAIDQHFAGATEFFELEYRVRCKDGSYRWILDRGQALRDASGQIIRMSGSETDITKRKATEEALWESERRYASLAATAPVAIFRFDATLFNCTYANEHWSEMTGRPIDSALGYGWMDALHPDDRDHLLAKWTELCAQTPLNQVVNIGEGRHLGPDDSINWFYAQVIREVDVNGAVTGYVGTLTDITNRKQLEQEQKRLRKEYEQRLEQSNAELSRATRLKDEFLANMSHELRTPLNAVLGMSEALQEGVFGVLNQHQQRSIATIESSGRHLLDLINDILEVSKIEAGKLELKITRVSLAQLCHASLTFVKHQAAQGQVHLEMSIPKEIGVIAVDERRIRQVLINLLNNAVKFTPPGGQVRLEVRLKHEACPLENCPASPNFSCALCFSVIDTGIGIAAADQARLFQPFTQIDSSLSRHYEGTGLGLTLVKRIIELHGGFVTVQSELGQGSCFTVCLPASCQVVDSVSSSPSVSQALESVVPEPMTRYPTDHPLLLLVDDKDVYISTIQNYLESKGYQVLVAKNDHEVNELNRVHHPNLILMNIQTPEVGDLEVICRIRSQDKFADVPIIALAALAIPGERERYLAAGANEYLIKPISLNQLTALIQQLL